MMPRLISILILCSATMAMAQVKEATDEDVQKMISTGKAYTFVFLKKGPMREKLSKEEVEKNQAAHLRYMLTLKRDGKLPLYGPYGDAGELRGFCIYNTADADEVKRNSLNPIRM